MRQSRVLEEPTTVLDVAELKRVIRETRDASDARANRLSPDEQEVSSFLILV